jgi:arylsulfatase A-like enzyme
MNILFAFADDWGRYASAYAQYENEKSLNKLISTPNFDRFAAEGILFRNAFVPAPSCTPCRSAVLSGQYFWQTGLGAILFGAVWDENIPTYPLELEKQGYFIGHTYKVWAPGRVMDAPYGGERTAYDKAGRDFGDFSFYVTKRAPEIGIEAAKEELYADNLPVNIQENLKQIQGCLIQMKEAEKTISDFKEKMRAIMIENNVRSITNDYFKIILVAETMTESFDKKSLEREYPDIASKFIKQSKKNSYIAFKIY